LSLLVVPAGGRAVRQRRIDYAEGSVLHVVLRVGRRRARGAGRQAGGVKVTGGAFRLIRPPVPIEVGRPFELIDVGRGGARWSAVISPVNAYLSEDQF
jgi:hypothetical protein